MLALCVGQHDVLDGKVKEAISAVPRLTQLVEKYDAHLVVTELFDHTTFAQSQPKYAKGVEDINWAWKHKVWTDAKMQCLRTNFIADEHFISDQMHLTVKRQKDDCRQLGCDSKSSGITAPVSQLVAASND